MWLNQINHKGERLMQLESLSRTFKAKQWGQCLISGTGFAPGTKILRARITSGDISREGWATTACFFYFVDGDHDWTLINDTADLPWESVEVGQALFVIRADDNVGDWGHYQRKASGWGWEGKKTITQLRNSVKRSRIAGYRIGSTP